MNTIVNAQYQVIDDKKYVAVIVNLNRFTHTATRRFARLPKEAFVRELNASGYPLHLPQATWANYRTLIVGL